MIGFLKDNGLLGKPGKHAITDVFHIESLDITTNLELHQMLTIIENMSSAELTNIDILSDIVFRYRFLNAGGTEDTPASEITAFCFLLFNENEFKYFAEIKKIMTTIGFNRIINFLESEDMKLPQILVNATLNMIGDELWLAITKDKNFEIDFDADMITTVQFMQKLMSRDSMNKRELAALLGSLGIVGKPL